MNNKNDEPKKFSFKEYYDSNPEFRKRHLAKCLTKERCKQCGRWYNHVYRAKHKRSAIHAKFHQLAIDAGINYAEEDEDEDSDSDSDSDDE